MRIVHEIKKDRESKFENALINIRQLTGYALKIGIIILISVIAWRIAWASVSFDLSKFDFSDLLAMILALFAIAMSVAFYFKTTDSSNLFYDNIYNFTQKTSEILGRIEERFGERLRHIDENNVRMQSYLVNNPKEKIEQKVKETEGKEEKEKEKLEKTNEALENLMNELYNKAKMQKEQKEEFNEKLKTLTLERDAAQERIREMENDRDSMRKQLKNMERKMRGELLENHSSLFAELLTYRDIEKLISHNAPSRLIEDKVRHILSGYPKEYLRRLEDECLIDSDNRLTSQGLIMLRIAGKNTL